MDRSGSVILENILRSKQGTSPVLNSISLHESIAVACWYIWWQRREVVHDGSVAPPNRTAFAIHALTANFEAGQKSAVRPKKIVWSKPPAGKLKLNIDAAFYVDGSGAVGAVLRNDRGEVEAGMASLIDHVLDAAAAEALALLRGLQFLQGLGVSSVLIESDSLELIQACNRKIEVWTPHAAILAESFMNASTMNGVAFQHCLREANVVAHQLAKYVYQTKENFIWEGDPPSFLLPFVIKDVTIVEV
jgi:ribonuclease HI